MQIKTTKVVLKAENEVAKTQASLKTFLTLSPLRFRRKSYHSLLADIIKSHNTNTPPQ